MTDSSSSTESTQDNQSSNSGYETTPPADAASEAAAAEQAEKDDLGYGDQSDGQAEKEAAAKAEADKIEAKKVEDAKTVDDPASGYGEDENNKEKSKDNSDDTDKGDNDKEKEKEGEDLAKEFEKVLDTLPEGFDKEKLSKFATEHKLTTKQLEAYVNLAKDDRESDLQQLKDNKAAKRESWKTELKEDADFGGENFDKNVDRVEKLLENQMVNTKKMLTETGGMLPPYVMKDLAALAKLLNPNNNLTGGEPPTVEDKDAGNYLEDLYQ